MNDLRQNVQHINIITDDILNEINEYTTYNSRGSINMAIDILETIKNRIENNEKITYDNNQLTIDKFKEIIDAKFTIFIFNSLFENN